MTEWIKCEIQEMEDPDPDPDPEWPGPSSDSEMNNIESDGEREGQGEDTVKRRRPDPKRYACPREGCSYVFNRPFRLNAHLRVHDGIKDYKCSVKDCDKSYSSHSHLLRHVKDAHGDTPKLRPYRCPHCTMTFSTKQNLNKHVDRKHDCDFPFKCEICDIGFSKEGAYFAHNYTHTGVMPFACNKCDKRFMTITEIKKHSRNHKDYECDQCKEIFYTRRTMLKHKRDSHKKEHRCDICQKKFSSQTNVNQHLKIYHDPAGERPAFQCPFEECSKVYSSKSNLTCHINTHHFERTFECVICKAQLSSEQKLGKHLQTHVKGVTLTRLKKKIRAPRKDIGTFKRSTAVKLAGIKVPLGMEKKIIEGEEVDAETVDPEEDDAETTDPEEMKEETVDSKDVDEETTDPEEVDSETVDTDSDETS